MTSTVVSSDVDLFSTAVAVDPYPVLAELRELSRVIHFPKYDVWMLSRYDDVKEATGDWETYTSRHGVALYDDFNKTLTGGVLATDPPEHDHLRAILYDKLTPRALRGLRIEVEGWAQQIADLVIDRGEFDACTDLAFEYPVTVMSNLLGLPEEGREKYRPGADAIFAGFGPLTEYLAQRVEALVKYNEWMDSVADPSKLTAGRWGATIMAAAAEGRLTRQEAVNTLKAFMTAGMDTTVNAISAMFQIFGEHPEVWTALRENPEAIRPALNETLRLESPVTGFFRMSTRDIEFDDMVIPQNKRVMLHWGAANRDPRKYPDPDRFVLQRNPIDHLGFGYGQHSCPGRGIAALEISALVNAFIPRVARFEPAGPAVRGTNPIVHGFDSLPLRVVRSE